MSTELVGPVAVVRFRDGTVIPYQPPRDTIDLERWRNCTEHRVACDCREAEMAEQIRELRAELKAAADACRDILVGHATFAWEESPDGGEREIGCMCTGCQIVRKAYLLPSYEAGPSGRDQVYGLSREQIDFGQRWRICTPIMQRDHPGVCQRSHTRPRDHYHEHLIERDGSPVLLPEFMEVPF